MAVKSRICLKRAYEPPAPEDGLRILVERLWPRGIRKEAAQLDEWAKELAPSTELRKWYNHQPERWEAFQERYRAELRSRPEQLQALRTLCQSHKKVTFVFAAKDEQRNSAVVLKHVLEETD